MEDKTFEEIKEEILRMMDANIKKQFDKVHVLREKIANCKNPIELIGISAEAKKEFGQFEEKEPGTYWSKDSEFTRENLKEGICTKCIAMNDIPLRDLEACTVNKPCGLEIKLRNRKLDLSKL